MLIDQTLGSCIVMNDDMWVWPDQCRSIVIIQSINNVCGKILNRLLLPIYNTTGNSGSGKTSLTAVLEKLAESHNPTGMIEGIKELTAGICPTHCEW